MPGLITTMLARARNQRRQSLPFPFSDDDSLEPADRERDRDPVFVCAFCRVRLETNVVHYCSRPAHAKKRCVKCKSLVADNTKHRCVQVITTDVVHSDPDLEEINADIEEKMATAVKVHIGGQTSTVR